MLLAHREENGKGSVLEQSLVEHLIEVGIRASKLGKEIGLEAFMKLAGYLHDSGKADRSFQAYIRKQTKRQVNHSSAGGRALEDLITCNQELCVLRNNKVFRYFKEILTYIIFAHHGLYDLVSYGETEHNTYRRLQYDKDDIYYYKEDVLPFVHSFDVSLQEKGDNGLAELIKNAYEEFKAVYSNLLRLSDKNTDRERLREEKDYYISCLTRLCLSILKEADIYDSANAFCHPKQHLWEEAERLMEWVEASERIEHMYHQYENSTEPLEINKVRNNLANLVKNAAKENDCGIFKLELPTGAGKTKAGLRYALTNAREYNRSRIFYITAYLSVLEQNAADIRSIIDKDEVILEHHSNMTEELKQEYESSEDKAEYEYKVYVKDSWENLIILTTMVQFFNTLFKDKSVNIRRFCKLINSVIIIDEIQSLPIKVLSNFNLMMNFMKEIMHCNIVHCTATQPVLDSAAMNYRIYYGNLQDDKALIVDIDLNNMECFQRVDFYNLTGSDARTELSTKELSAYIEAELNVFDSCLVVLNTKAAVASLYDYLDANLSGVEIIYLTTNLCAAHRLDAISDMKEELLENRRRHTHNKIVCISTQLIEAGVDVDFDVVFRSLAGIDSLIQCAGRCNREGKLILNGSFVHGKLYIIRYLEESLSNLQEIKATSDASEYALRRWEGIQHEETNIVRMDELQIPYFAKYYVENKCKLDYTDTKRNSNMLEELGRNQPARDAYYMGIHGGQKPVMFQAFKTAAENFELIGQETIGVIVNYKNQTLLDQLEMVMEKLDYSGINNLLQQLQRYTVNMYISTKLKQFITKDEDFDVYLLQKEYYNGKRGVVMDQLADLII